MQALYCNNGIFRINNIVVHCSWQLDVRPLVSTKKWLSNYGLKKNKLDIVSLMEAIGFKKRDGN